MKKRVYFDAENNLAVETLNGTIRKDGAIVKLDGYFTIDANDVEKLLVLVNKEIIFYNSLEKYGYLISKEEALCLLGEKYQKMKIYYEAYEEELKKDFKVLKENNKQLEKEIANLKRRGLIARILNK